MEIGRPEPNTFCRNTIDARPDYPLVTYIALPCYVFLRFIFIPPGPISTYSQSEKRLIAMVPPTAIINATIAEVATPADGATAATAPAPIGPVAKTRGTAAIIPPTATGPHDFANFTAFSFFTKSLSWVIISWGPDFIATFSSLILDTSLTIHFPSLLISINAYPQLFPTIYLSVITPGSRAGLEPRSSGKPVDAQPIIKT